MLYQNILDEIVDESKMIFKEDLTGIYLHGSLAMGCFNPKKSDIDLMIPMRICNGLLMTPRIIFIK